MPLDFVQVSSSSSSGTSVKSNEVSTGPVTGTLSRGYRSGSHTRGDIRMRIMIFT